LIALTSTKELIVALVQDLLPKIEKTIENGDSESKIAAMKLLYKILTRSSSSLGLEIATQLIKKLVAWI